MDKLSKLNEEIYVLRQELENLMLSKRFRDEQVLALSEKLDSLIAQYYMVKNGTSS